MLIKVNQYWSGSANRFFHNRSKVLLFWISETSLDAVKVCRSIKSCEVPDNINYTPNLTFNCIVMISVSKC